MYWTMMKQSTWAIKLAVVLAAILLLCGSHYYLYDKGYDSGYDVATDKAAKVIAQQERDHTAVINQIQEDLNKALAEKSRTEAEANRRINQLQKEKQSAIKRLSARYTAAVNELRSRVSRAENFNEDGTPRDSASAAANSCGGGCTGRQLSREDAEFLVGEAAKADTLRESLRVQRQAYEELARQYNQ